MLITGIKSKPVYAPLRADIRGRHHLMLALGAGDALLTVLAELGAAAPESLPRSRVLYAPGAAPEPRTLERLGELEITELVIFDDAPQLLREFRLILERSVMGTRLYVAGPESFIGMSMQIALEFDLNQDEIRAEEIGTSARRVYCVHCRAVTQNVRTNIVACTGCARSLLVRDHYSRRLASYMGVMADAEVPGELPAIAEVYV